MLSIETEDKIAKLFLYLSDYYQVCQKAKSSLNADCQFDPTQIFNRLDRLHKGYVDAYDILTFFKEHSVHCSLNDAMKIIMWYDYNFDEQLTYSEFANLIMADETRSISLVNFKCYCLPCSVESGLLNVLCSELESSRIASELIMDIKCRYDFSPQSFLGVMKGIGYVNKEHIRNFLNRSKREFNEKDIANIMLRMDIQKNYRISIAEIERIFYYPNQEHLYSDSNNTNKPLSPIGNNKSINDKSNNNKNNQSCMSQSLNSSLRNTGECNNTSLTSSQFLSNSFNASNNINTLMSSKQSNDALLLSLFSLIIQTESQIEQIKIELSLRSDFNAEDAFAVFESNNSGLIYPSDLQYGLSCFGLNPTRNEVYLLIQKYSLMNTDSLNYADFFDMVVPFDKDARRMIEKRLPSPYVPKYDRTNCFLGGTKDIIGRLLEYIIISENKLEVIRKQINRKLTFDFTKFCEEIDINKKGYITHEDLWNYLSQRQKSLTQRESDLFFIRLDRNRDGKVEYDNIKQECLQKTPS